MDKEKNIQSEEELEKTLYSTLNVGSFLEIKKKAREQEKEKNVKELFEEPKKKEIIKEEKTKLEKEPLKVEEKKQVVNKKEVSKQDESKVSLEKKEPPKRVIPLVKEEAPKTDVITKKEEVIKQQEEKENVVAKTEFEPENSLKNEKVTEEKRKKEKVKKEKKSKEGKKKSKALLIGVIVCIVLDLFALIGLFLTYGPISYFRNLLVTTAMTTQSHKYLARTFYDDDTIEKVLANNFVAESGQNTDTSDINFAASEDTGVYESIYEEQILKRDKEQVYKLIDIKGSNYVGYLVVVYDPSRVELVGATSYGYGGALPTDIAKRNDAKVLINASGFINATSIGKGSMAVGSFIKDGKLVSRTGSARGYGGGIAGFNKDNVLVLTKDSPEQAIANGVEDAVEFGPFLIVNGEAAKISGNGGWGIAPRTVLAQRQDGIVLFLVIDGRNAKHSLGADMNELIKILKRYKAHNAVNLDGGGSSSLVIEGKLTNKPCGSYCGERYIPNAWIVK